MLGLCRESSQLKCSMYIDLSKLQHSVALAEQREPEGVSKTFKKAFVPKGITVSPKRSRFEPESLAGIDTPTAGEIVLPKVDTTDRENLEEREKGKGFELECRMAEVLPHDQLPDFTKSKKEDGKALRAAEGEINRNLAKVKQPPAQPVRELRQKPITKEQHSFTRAYATMTLSSLRSIEKVHEARRKGKELMRKANLVSKIKQERIVGRSKIEEYQRSLRESVMEWKTDETLKLEEARNKKKEEHEAEISKRLQMYDKTLASKQKRGEDLVFVREFETSKHSD